MNVESQRRYRTYLLVLAYLIVMMEGIGFGASTSGMTREKGILYSFALGLVLMQVCIVDCRIAGRPLPLSSYWLVFILYGIAVPICIVRARGLRGLGYVAAHCVGMALVLILSLLIAIVVFDAI